MKLAIWGVLLLLVGWGAYLFGKGNGEIVAVDLLMRTLPGVPLWAALLGSAAVGALLALFALSPSLVRLRLRTRRQSRDIDKLEQEVHGLRTLPLSDEIETAEPVKES